MATIISTPLDKATAVAEQVAAGAKATGEQVLSTVRQGGELALEVGQSWFDLAVSAAPKLSAATFTPSRKDVQDLLNTGFAQVEKVVSIQKAAAGALLDVILPANSTK